MNFSRSLKSSPGLRGSDPVQSVRNSNLIQQSLQTQNLVPDGGALCWAAVLLPARQEMRVTDWTGQLDQNEEN